MGDAAPDEGAMLIRLEILRATLDAASENSTGWETIDVLTAADQYAQWVITGEIPK